MFPTFTNLYIKNELIKKVKGDLYPDELVAAKGMAAKRYNEYAAGRLLAKNLLLKFNISNFPILPNSDRSPVWPKDIIGSISHNHERCMVAVCRKTDYKSVGVDVETIERIKPQLWKRICTNHELSNIHEIMPSLRKQYAAIIFSAKESFYKCQYSLTNLFINFHDVEIVINKEKNQFTIIPINLPLNFPTLDSFVGYYELHSECIKTLCLFKD